MEASLLDSLFGHNHWATRVILRHCRLLSREQFHQRFEIGPGSLHDTLMHIIGAMRRWADRIGERPLRPRLEERGTPYSPDELLALLEEAHAELFEVVRAVAASGRLTEIMEFQRPDGPPYRFTRATAIVHVATHGMHHRAQAVNMLRRLGRPIEGADLDTVEWECVKTGQFRDPYPD